MSSAEPRGAYGFRLASADPGVTLPDLGPVAHDAPDVLLDWGQGTVPEASYEVGTDHFRMSQAGGGSLDVDRRERTVRAVVPLPVSPAAMVHPLATMPLSFMAHWRGDATLHGGAFMHDGRAWIVCGEAEAGKSSLLATLALRGHPILSDDLLVIADGHVWAGPRCVDLRPDVAERFPGARSLGVVAGRVRHRLTTPAGPSRAPLGGIVLLEWATSAVRSVEPVELADRLRVLHAQHYATRLAPPLPHQVFALLDPPMWRLRRVRDWTTTDATIDQLLDVVADA